MYKKKTEQPVERTGVTKTNPKTLTRGVGVHPREKGDQPAE